MIAASPSRSRGWSSTLKTRMRGGLVTSLSIQALSHCLMLEGLAWTWENTAVKTILVRDPKTEFQRQLDLGLIVPPPCRPRVYSKRGVWRRFSPRVRAYRLAPNGPRVPTAACEGRFRGRCRAPARAIGWKRIE